MVSTNWMFSMALRPDRGRLGVDNHWEGEIFLIGAAERGPEGESSQVILVPILPRPTLPQTIRALKNRVRLTCRIGQFPSMPVSPIAPVAPAVGQLWHQTGVKSETVPKLERVLQWDGTDWVIAGLVTDSATVMKQGLQVCGFQEALADAHASTKWFACEFIYAHDGSTWGNA
jgi:hypothetical protein